MLMRFRKFTALAAAGLLAATGGCARQQVAEAPAAAVPAAPVGPALWKVADADTTIYLFGTIHALPPETQWMRPSIADALAKSDTLVTEVELNADTIKSMQQEVMAKGMLPVGENLRDMLTAEQRAKYEAAVTRLGLKPETFDRFEPWYAAMMMTMLPLIKQGYATSAGVEKVLGGQAGAEKARASLETVEYQLAIFDSLSKDAQVRYLMEVIDGNQDIKAMLDKMVAEWMKGDADKLAELMNQGLTDADLADKLLYQRNRNWADWIAKRLDRPGTVFVAVGAGHLAGTNSVQQDLAAKGIAVERLQ
jgi:uncharacterized protein YbaP (TraB family)